jgi:hypothetical protein
MEQTIIQKADESAAETEEIASPEHKLLHETVKLADGAQLG